MRQPLGTALLLAMIATPGSAFAQNEAPPLWSVPSDVVIERRPMTIDSRGAKLSGTLFMPSGSCTTRRRDRCTADAFV